MGDPHSGSHVSKGWGRADRGLPKNQQVICWQLLGCMDYEAPVVVNLKAGVMDRTWCARIYQGPKLYSRKYLEYGWMMEAIGTTMDGNFSQ